ncbi:tail fiber domain-containing protein [Hymenobacter busanensis]|nr:tail fiber domain-containing protein [Hymenobacter busanensis]QHJ07970.1 hypothetical protein GUY19_12015 [Hymenobacter busanensis]
MQRFLRFAFPLAAALGLNMATAQAQTTPTGSVGIGTTTPDASAVLDLSSVTKGLLAPRMTASQRAAIQGPAQGLLVYQTDGIQPGFWYYTGTAWTYLSPTASGDDLGNHTATQNLNLADKLLVGNGGTQGLRLSSSGQAGLGGVVPTNWLDIQGASRSNTHPSGRTLYVTGDFDQAANGVEIRHSNATQGVGIGYNSIYAAGTNTNHNLNLMPKGTGSVGIGTTDPAASALVDMTSTTKGFLPPRLTSAQRDAISSPAAGLTIFNLETQKLNIYNAVTSRWTDAVQSVAPGTTGSVTFNYTGGTQTWTVPAGVTSLQVDMAGAQGRYFVPRCGNCAAPGLGGRVQGTLAVQPGQVLTIEVGGAVVNGSGWQNGGYNGGGSGSYPGGGATDIRIGGTGLSNRVLVAGGGGGGFSTTGPGGAGGGLTGGSAGNATGGSQSAGGQRAGNPAQFCYCSAIPADQGQGGGTTSSSWATAGGGGGYYGGGASFSDYSGGGGGSSYADPTLTSNVTHVQGARGGSGFVTFSFTVGPEAPYLSLSNATTSQAAGSVVYSDGSKLAGNAAQLYWDAAGSRLGIGTGSPQAKLHVAGDARISGLGGSGARMVVADNNGQLAAQALPADAQTLTLSGQQLSISGGNAVTLPNGADNLGNHTATQNLNLANKQLVGNGGTQGLSVTSTGGLVLPAGVIQRGGAAVTATSDLGLYSRLNGSYMRLVTNNAPIRFYSDDDAGTTANVSIESNGNVGIGTGNGNPTNRLDVQTTAGRSGTHAVGRPLYVTGDFDEAAGGSEFRHYNGSQGVGIGFNSVYAAGSNTNQHLNLMPKGSGGVGIGTTAPGALLDVNGNQVVRGSVSFGASVRQMINLFNADYAIGVQGGTQYFRTGEAFAWYNGGSHNDNQFNAGGGSTQMVLKGSFLGLGAGYSTSSGPYGPLEIRRDNASPYIVMHDPGDAWFSFGMDYNDGRKIKINEGNGFGSTNYMTFSGSNVGIGTTSPAFPLDVQSTVTPGNYAYGWFNGSGATGYTGSNTGPVSIRAAGRVVATEFNATSDRRLKSIIGLSDNAADLALLQQLRITDYTLRDRVQYGSRQFKKVIAQEVEQVFPQAVTQHSGFLPDVYVQATATEMQADSLLRLTLPAAPATAIKAGQRVKLLTKTGEVIGTVKAAAGNTLVVRGARQLVGQEVFVFGLEHADVRAVDYEALSMLNVSATQELARRVQELQKQNEALRRQTQTQQTALQQLQTQTAAANASLAERLQTLESMMGAKAEAK